MKPTTTSHITLSNPTPKYGDTVTFVTHGISKNLLSKGTFLCAVFVYQGQCVMVTEKAGNMAGSAVKAKDGTYSVTSDAVLLAGPGSGSGSPTDPSPYPNLPGYLGGAATAVATTYTDKGGVHTMVGSASFNIGA